jgi:hypothetical protein
MSWKLENSIDAAFVAYLKPLLPGTIKVYPSCTNDELQYPCVVPCAGEGENENNDIGFNGHRKIQVVVAVMVESADELDEAGVKIKTALQRISEAYGEVMEALAIKYLEADLNAVNSPGVKFSFASVMATSAPTYEGRLFIRTINVEVIANPVKI